jgi:4-amino-4-deoxy-L-arabinose transferase-like glycosyltransferase
MSPHLSNRRWQILVLFCLTLAVILPGLSGLPVIDRDEARFAQASVQMAESNDWLNIRFQDEARNKKPAAAYWAQAAMIKIFSPDGERRIWAQRLPSLFAALISVLALYWGGAKMIGRDAAFVAAALLAVSMIFVFEGHIAKTDALLCASTTMILACLGRMRLGSQRRREVWGFWIALGLSIMIKGPIGLILATTCLASLWFWERHLSWARPLLNGGAIAVFVLIWLPWGIAMYIITDGAFFVESLGKDLGAKVASGQEGHGAPPGSHTLAIWATLWPASLFLIPGLAYAFISAKSGTKTRLSRAMRFMICWTLPFWLLIELMPTKLPHYGLPVFPALCLMIGAFVMSMTYRAGFQKTRLLGGFVFFIASACLIGVMFYLQTEYGASEENLMMFLICGFTALAVLIAIAALWINKIRISLLASLLSGLVYFGGAYGFILPNFSDFKTSERMAAKLEDFAPNTRRENIHSPHYREPSLVYHVGKNIDLTARPADLSDGGLLILNLRHEETERVGFALSQAARSRGQCLRTSDSVKGFNYSKGTPLNLVILREAPC